MKQKLRHETPLTNRAQEIKNQASEEPSRGQEAQTGRSMVEMLGVLAIVGVLSIGGIAGYTQAMNRYKANEIVDTASKLCIIAKTRDNSYSNDREKGADFTDLDIQGPVAGCATNIVVRLNTTYGPTRGRYCTSRVEGCNNETGVKNALTSLLGQQVNEYGSFIGFSDMFDEH